MQKARAQFFTGAEVKGLTPPTINGAHGSSWDVSEVNILVKLVTYFMYGLSGNS